jgi:hypothetical protein
MWPFTPLTTKSHADHLVLEGTNEENPDLATSIWMTMDWDNPFMKMRSSKVVRRLCGYAPIDCIQMTEDELSTFQSTVVTARLNLCFESFGLTRPRCQH